MRCRPGVKAVCCLVVLAAIAVASCTSTLTPVSEILRAQQQRSIVVFVPGVTGATLIDSRSGREVWGTGRTLMRPHDRGHGSAKSVSPVASGPAVVPGSVILDLRLFGLLRFEVYQPLVDLFVANGYRHGVLTDPRPGDDFFLFAYDWRADNVESAALLATQLEALRRRLATESLAVNLICQSNGAHVCRYFARFGGASLEQAEAGVGRRDPKLQIERLILVGSSNGGSIRVLRELNRGRRYVQTIGRLFSPETLFTFASLFQDLPVYSKDLFVDSQGAAMAVDLFDADNWERYGWSIYAPAVERQLSDAALPDWFGSSLDRRRHLERSLELARRFHRVLHADVGEQGPVPTYLITNGRNQTTSRAVLLIQDGRWRTLFDDDREVRRSPQLLARVTEGGDGHATVASQNWLSPREAERLQRHEIDADVSHRRLVLRPETQAILLEILSGSSVSR